MPRRLLAVPGEWTAADEIKYIALIRDADRRADCLFRLVKKYFFFCRANIDRRWKPGPESIVRFLVQMLVKGYSPHSVTSWQRSLMKWRAAHHTEEEVMTRIRDYYLIASLTAGSAKTPMKRVKVQCDHVLEQMLLFRPGDSATDEQYRLLWFLVLATGCRPANLRDAMGIRCDPVGVSIQWGPRKGGRTGFRKVTVYLTAWSYPRPPDLGASGTDLACLMDGIFKSSNIASALNAWLKRRSGRSDITSSMARDRMAAVLVTEKKEGRIDTAEYEWLMDHTWQVGVQYYAREGTRLSWTRSSETPHAGKKKVRK